MFFSYLSSYFVFELQSNLPNGHLSKTAIFFFFLRDSPYIHSYFNLSTMATFFCPQGGRYKEVQLYWNRLQQASSLAMDKGLLLKYTYFNKEEWLNQETDLNASMSYLTPEMHCWYHCILFQAPK